MDLKSIMLNENESEEEGQNEIMIAYTFRILRNIAQK